MLRAGDLVGRQLLSADDECVARSDVALYRFDDGSLQEVVSADPRLRAALTDIAATRQAVPASSGAPSTLAPGLGGGRPPLIPRLRHLFGRR